VNGLVNYSEIVLTGLLLVANPLDAPSNPIVDSSYFEGRWAFVEEACDLPTNWTMIGGGNFVSEDLTGNWNWEDGKLVLNLIDLAIDEETGEAGGRFQMDGPVEIVDPDSFKMSIAPDIYHMKRCKN